MTYLTDEELYLISVKCPNLTTFKLFIEYGVTEVGMASLGRIATRLKKFSCRSCRFGAKALNALLSQSSSLQIISLDWLFDGKDYPTELINPGAAASSLKSISLNGMVHFPELFQPLITGTKNLSSLKLGKMSSWHNVLNMLAKRDDNNVFKVYLKKVKVGPVSNLVKFL